MSDYQRQLEEVRKKRAAEWRSRRGLAPSSSSSSSSTQGQRQFTDSNVQQVVSDEELARRLQEQYDREADEEASGLTTTPSRRATTRSAVQGQANTFPPQRNIPPFPIPDIFSATQRRMRRDRMLGGRDLSPLEDFLESTEDEDFEYNLERQRNELPMPDMVRQIIMQGNNPLSFQFFRHGGNLRDVDNLTYEELLNMFEPQTVGASEEEIEGNTFSEKVKDVAALPEEKKSCGICLENYVNGDEVRTLKCFHMFHKSCVDNWLKSNKTCPVCRMDVDSSPQNEENN